MNTVDQVIRFQLHGKVAHFSRAETQTSILSYPVPPRTVLLGLVAAILGVPKDAAPKILEPCQIAVNGGSAGSHWHTAKLRKDPPEPLPRHVKAKQAGDRNGKEEKASLITQEWLWRPRYTVWVELPNAFQSELMDRLLHRRWHFTPYLGISEMLAEIDETEAYDAIHLPRGSHSVSTVVRHDAMQINVDDVLDRELGLRIFSMPRTVSVDRVFTHEKYVMESSGNAVIVETDQAYQIGDQVVTFL